MNPVLMIIHHRNIPTGSYVQAIRHIMERPDFEQSQYQNLINEMMEAGKAEFIEHKIDDPRQTKYTYLYLVQETIRKTDSTDVLDMDAIYALAYNRAETYIAENQYVWAEPEDAPTKTDSNGKPKRKKGAKQEEAARIYNENKEAGKVFVVNMFMAELDMSKAGATTYFYNMRKKHGE